MSKYFYDEAAAERPIHWIEQYITHIIGEKSGEPLILAEFQKDILRQAFGWYYTDKPSQRKVQYVYIEIPRGNAKSTFGSAVGLYLLIGDRQSAARVYSCAGSKDQASAVFDPAKSMVRNNEDLSAVLRIYHNSIYDDETNSTFKVISADGKYQHGQIPSGIIFDELHVQPNSVLYDSQVTGMAKRLNSMMFILTTAGIVNSFAEEIHDYAVKVRDGIIEDNSFLPFIWGATEDDDPFDPVVWERVNPGWEWILKDAYANLARKAKNQPSFLSTFQRYNLNMWLGSAETWIPAHEWAKCNTGEIDLKALAGRKCYAGLDLASVRDTSALALFFPGDEVHILICYFFCPEKQVHTRSEFNVKYDKFVNRGEMIATPGDAQDYEFIKAKIKELSGMFNIVCLEYDRALAASLVVNIEGVRDITPHGQGFLDMSPPSKEFEKMIINRQINHGGNSCLTWQVSNATIDTDPADNIKPTKKKSKDKIDGVVASIMAIGGWMKRKNNKGSKYEREGLVSLR